MSARYRLLEPGGCTSEALAKVKSILVKKLSFGFMAMARSAGQQEDM